MKTNIVIALIAVCMFFIPTPPTRTMSAPVGFLDSVQILKAQILYDKAATIQKLQDTKEEMSVVKTIITQNLK